MNLYAYVGNDPINGVDPLGLWTLGFRINVSLVLVDFSVNFVFDDNGNAEFQLTPGVGGTLGASVTGGFTVTGADRICDLHHWGNVAGVAVGEGVVVEANYIWGEGYQGWDIGLGAGGGPSPVTPQYFKTYTVPISASKSYKLGDGN